MATTLQTMLTLLRQRTNMEVSQYVTDAELTSYLNNSLCLLDGILISKFSDYKLSSTIVSVDASSNLTLPSDFLKLRGVDVVLDIQQPDGYQTLTNYQFKQRNKRRFTGTLTTISSLEYRLEGGKVNIIPSQISNQYQYRLWYTPDYIPLVNTTDTLQAYMDSQAWYEYAICDSAVKVLAKQNMDPSTFMAQAAELKEHIQKVSAPNRDAGEPVSVVDTRGARGFGYGWEF